MSNHPRKIIKQGDLSWEVAPVSPVRQQLLNYLALTRRKYDFSVFLSFDMTKFEECVQLCRARKRRPPSTVAYIVRCLGALLPEHRPLLAGIRGGYSYIPQEINAMIMVECTAEDGEKIPQSFTLENIDTKSMAVIAVEMKRSARSAKRQIITPTKTRVERILFPRAVPAWWYSLKQRLAHLPFGYTLASTVVAVSSITQITSQYAAWGAPAFAVPPIIVMLGGMSKRPVVVGDEVVARTCLDLTLIFDHRVIDGAPAARFSVALRELVEGGALLAEYLQDSPESGSDTANSATDDSLAA